MKLDKAVDMSRDGGFSPHWLVVRYFGRIGKLRFILDLNCNYPPLDYEKLESGEDPEYKRPEDDYKKELAWEMKMLSKLRLNKGAKAVSLDFYDKSSADEFDEEHTGWMEEYKYSWPAFALEEIKPDPLFWEGIYRVRKILFKNIFSGAA